MNALPEVRQSFPIQRNPPEGVILSRLSFWLLIKFVLCFLFLFIGILFPALLFILLAALVSHNISPLYCPKEFFTAHFLIHS